MIVIPLEYPVLLVLLPALLLSHFPPLTEPLLAPTAFLSFVLVVQKTPVKNKNTAKKTTIKTLVMPTIKVQF